MMVIPEDFFGGGNRLWVFLSLLSDIVCGHLNIRCLSYLQCRDNVIQLLHSVENLCTGCHIQLPAGGQAVMHTQWSNTMGPSARTMMTHSRGIAVMEPWPARSFETQSTSTYNGSSYSFSTSQHVKAQPHSPLLFTSHSVKLHATFNSAKWAGPQVTTQVEANASVLSTVKAG
jgi:hypothetical protein